MRGSSFTIAPVVFLAGLGMALAAGAADWQGTTEIREGVEHVMNPAQPMAGPVTLTLQELWRVGGDSEAEEEFFGVITQITTDPEGNIYLLDQQLNEVRVFSRDGEYLRTIGREGEGPGEFRTPQDMFFLPDGNLGVMQLAPGRIVMLSPEGEPLGDYPLPEDETGASPILVAGGRMGDHVLLVISENKPKEGQVDIKRALIQIDSEGNETKRMLESTRVLEFVNFLFKETVWRTFDNRWRVSPAGELYAAEHYLPYEIAMWDAAGEKKRVISREFDHWDRTDDQKQEMYDIFDALLQNQLPQYEIEVSDHDPDIFQFYPREDGTLWVLTSRGMRERPDGALGVFDVFDSNGRFVRELTLIGEGVPFKDGYFFLGDRLFVVTDLLEANIASRGGRTGEGDEEAEEPEPIAVICYQLDVDAAGM